MNREKLKRLRKAAGTLEEISDAIGISVSQLSRAESGDRELRVSELVALANRLSVAPAVFLSDACAKIIGRIGAGAEVMSDVDQSDIFEIETTIPIANDMIGFEVTGNSMYPRYDDGDILLCSRHGVALDALPSGTEAAVHLDDGRRFVKKVRRDNGGWTLESHNAEPIVGTKIIWASKIAHVVRRAEVRRLDRLAQRSDAIIKKKGSRRK